MKYRRRIFPAMAALLLALSLCPCSALAAGDGAAENTETAPAQAEPPALYPTEVLEYTAGDLDEPRISKTYELSPTDDPALIPTEDFERSGRVYTLLDIIKEDQTETDTKEHIEVITLETDTSDMAEILQLLEPELEITTEDGYTGVLTPDYPSIQVEASGYGTSSRTVSATRTYPNLSSADVCPHSQDHGGGWAHPDPGGRGLAGGGHRLSGRLRPGNPLHRHGHLHRHRHQQIRHRLHGHGGLQGGCHQDQLRHRDLYRDLRVSR